MDEEIKRPERVKRAVLYVRVSTDKQEAYNQAKQLREYCQNVGYNIVHEYCDVMSGTSTKRPHYNQMFADAAKYLFDVVVFWDISRFSRSGVAYTLQKLQQLENLKIEWESYQEPYFRSLGPFKDAVVAIMAAVAKMERDKISERTKAGLERVRQNGVRLGRPTGAKDRRKRRRKGYYDNSNARRFPSDSNKWGSEINPPNQTKTEGFD